MATKVEVHGDRNLPLLTCVHGLLGGPGDFLNLAEPWKGKFCLVLVDMNPECRDDNLANFSKTGFGRVSYDDAAADIYTFLSKEFPSRPSYFVGLSIGGKVIYDFINAHPELYLGSVICDVGPGLIPESALYNFVEVTVPGINLDQEWPALKQEIMTKILDRNLRILIQTQLHYPSGKPPAVWKPGMAGLQGMLDGARIKEQWDVLDKLTGKTILIRAGYLSGIPDKDVARLKDHPAIVFKESPNSAHFVHISHREVVQNAVLDLLSN